MRQIVLGEVANARDKKEGIPSRWLVYEHLGVSLITNLNQLPNEYGSIGNRCGGLRSEGCSG